MKVLALAFAIASAAMAQSPAAPAPSQDEILKSLGSTRHDADPTPPKKEGIRRVCIALPAADLGSSHHGNELNSSVRQSMGNYLSGPLLEAFPVESRIDAQIQAEAKAKQCDFLLESSLTRKAKPEAGMKRLVRVARPAASIIPYTGAASSTAGAIATVAVVTTAASLSGYASEIKGRDELTFEYRISTLQTGTAPVTGKTSAVAKDDGQDILTPLIEQACSAAGRTILGQ